MTENIEQIEKPKRKIKLEHWGISFVFLAVIGATLLVDQLTKFLRDDYVANHGIAFSWLEDVGSWVLILISSLLIVGGLAFYFVHRRSIKLKRSRVPLFYDIAFAIFIGGAMGNWLDRVIFQYVRDFLQLSFWPQFPIFNWADVFINIGVVLIVIYILFMWGGEKNGKGLRKRKQREAEAGQLPADPLDPTPDPKPNKTRNRRGQSITE